MLIKTLSTVANEAIPTPTIQITVLRVAFEL